MNRNLLFAAVACAIASPAIAAQRVISLEADPPEGARRFISALKNLSLDGDKPTTWETITRTGVFHDERYGEFEITRAMLLQMVDNFDKGTYGQQVFIDVSHEPSKGAAAKILKLAVEGNKLRALLEWTPYGIDAVKNRGFSYLSAMYIENWRDNEKRALHGAVLLGAGLTIHPVVKYLDPIDATRLCLSHPDGTPPTLLHPDLRIQLQEEVKTMWKELIKRLTDNLKALKLSEADSKALIDQATAAVEKITDVNHKGVAEVLIGAMENAGKQLAEARAAGNTGTIQLSISAPAAGGLSEEQVKKLMEDTSKAKEDQVRKLAETQTARRKLLADTINAAEGIPDDVKKARIEAVQDLVTADISEDVVKRLAATQIATANELVAARKLSGLGYQGPQGHVHIEVVGAGEITALQAEIDKRLYAGMPAHQRYALSEGKPVEGNKAIVEKCLQLYDAQHGRRLVEEYRGMKKLAAGDGIVSDVAIPASFERTVIREALYQLVGLGLCDVGTAQYAAVVQLPYSFRDTTAAGVSSARKYEGQAIARAGVKQALEEARPIPQKLAFEVSDELRYLVGNGQINFDIVAENARNASRIIGEDTEQLLFNEILNASDEQNAVEVNAEAVANGDAAKTIFVLDNFPVVRPRKVFDLQGNQVGNTLYPIDITVNAVAIAEYTGGQGAGMYYKMNHNLGEIEFVDETGAPDAPAAVAIVASYHYTANVFKWDSDLGALKVDEKYDDFLYRFGLRKAVIEDRSYMANIAIMSGTLRTQIEQARQFSANFKRAGTDLMADGNLGRIKDVPSFRSYAPGLNIGDVRTVLFERGTTRFRMLKPWTMGQLENQKDANGRFTGKKEAYGDQFIVVHTPLELRKAFTSIVAYSAAARVDR